MKFSHSIQLNASPEWREHYLAYSHLKKIIYAIEKATLGLSKLPDSHKELSNSSMNVQTQDEARETAIDIQDELSPLLPNAKLSLEEANVFFRKALDDELNKVTMFYTVKEEELLARLQTLVADIWTAEHREESQLIDMVSDREVYSHTGWDPSTSTFSSRRSASPVADHSSAHPSTHGTLEASGRQSRHGEESGGDSNAELAGRPIYLPFLIWSGEAFKHHRQSFQKRCVGLFVVLCELRDYVEIHETGFSKVLKKYEKVVGARLKREYMAKVEGSYPFLHKTKEGLQRALSQVTQSYARIATEGKLAMAQSELKSYLREHIVWERNTIWRDMVELERRRETIGLRTNASNEAPMRQWVAIHVCCCTVHVPTVIPAGILAFLFASIVLLAIVFVQPLSAVEQNNCLAILVFASILWASEAVPLFVTSMLIPLLVVVLRVQREGGKRLDANAAAKQIFSVMFGPVIMLLLGGFSLASALSKHNIAKAAAGFILSRAGSKPRWVLLANMFVSTFASMWISNVAAPVLCFSLVTPILRNLPRRSPYARCLVMGIAMAANVGGMASPISSPQNVIAMANMNPPPSWLEWFVIALPVCLVLDACICALLLVIYKPTESASPPELYGPGNFGTQSLNHTQIYILAVMVVTIGLWCVEASIDSVVGDMGVIAILPIVAFYGTGILTKDDWNSMLWSVVMLAMGGIALGKSVQSSGLLAEITTNLAPMLAELSEFSCFAILTAVVVIVTSFISHTVGALIILPVVAEIGASLPDPLPRTLVMASALLCSGGMGLPVSSFPNMNAISLEDQTGTPWLTVTDFLQVGLVSSVFAWASVMSIGYTIMSFMNFG